MIRFSSYNNREFDAYLVALTQAEGCGIEVLFWGRDVQRVELAQAAVWNVYILREGIQET